MARFAQKRLMAAYYAARRARIIAAARRRRIRAARRAARNPVLNRYRTAMRLRGSARLNYMFGRR